MSKKLLKIKIHNKPTLKEHSDSIPQVISEIKEVFRFLSTVANGTNAKNARIAFKKFAKVADVIKPGIKAPKKAAAKITKFKNALPELKNTVIPTINGAMDLAKEIMADPNVISRADNLDGLIKELKDMEKYLTSSTAKNLGPAGKRHVDDILKPLSAKIKELENFRETNVMYIAAASKRAKQAGKTVDEIVDILPDPRKVKQKFAGSKYATEAKEIIEATGKEGAEQAAKKGSKWQKWLIGAGLLGTALAIYKALPTDTADAETKKKDPKPDPQPVPDGGGGGSTAVNLAIQVTGISDGKTAVAEIQSILTELGFSIGQKGLPNAKEGIYNATLAAKKGRIFIPEYNIIGIYGPRTKEAVKKFQQKFGLKVDGLVGNNTWAKMMEFAKSDKNKRWKGGEGYRSMVAQVLGNKDKAETGETKKDPAEKVTKNDAKKAVRDIYDVIRELENSKAAGGWQHIVNAYIDVRRDLVTKLMREVGKGDMSTQIGSEADLGKLVSNVLPPIQGETIQQKMNHARENFLKLPGRIINSTINTIHINISAQDVLDMSVKTLIEYSKDRLDIPDVLKKPNMQAESKRYNIDFSKWLKTF